jgi:uncharacterized membrane protein (UPF0136 family)
MIENKDQFVWMMPLVILYTGILYGFLLLIGAVYGFLKTASWRSLFRDLFIVIEVLLSSHLGIRTGHWGGGLIGIAIGSALSMSLHSREFSKTNDMAPFGHMTAVSVIASLFDVAGILTCSRL